MKHLTDKTPFSHTAKRPIAFGGGFILAFVFLLLTACTEQDKDPEHEATPAHAEEAKQQEHDEEGTVELKPETLAAQGIVIEALAPKPVAEVLRLSGEITFNENRRVVLTARSSGWAEKVTVFANHQVEKNQLLANIYSPEFLSAQHEYLLIRKRASGDTPAEGDARSLLADAHERLRILGLTDKEIRRLAQTGKPYRYQHIHSPIRGTVIEHRLNAGDTVEPGQKLYVIASLRTVWAELALTEAQFAKVRPGQTVSLFVKAYPNQRFQGRLLSIGANVDEATRTVKARALIDNPKRLLKPGMFAEAEIAIGDGKPALALPESAVLRSPDGDWVVFVEEEPGHFKPVEIRVVRSVDGRTVIDGLKPGVRVVTQGAFFIQSELAKAGFEVHQH